MRIGLLASALSALFMIGCGADSNKDSLSEIKAAGPLSCTIQTVNGRFLTAVGGGGRLTDVIHSDATVANSWERFILVDSGDGTPNIRYGIRTKTGHFLTAVSGGGRINDVIHSDAVQLRDWEKFQLISQGGGWYAIRTIKGYYLTAVGGGGRISDVLHSDATRINSWEKFFFNCRSL